MSWLQSVLQGEVPGITLTLIVLVLAIALVLLFWIFRKIAGANQVKTGRARRPRLSVTDAAVVDDKRRLVLIRRDNVEHLVMIGGPTDIVIEQHIAVSAAPHIEQAAEPESKSVEAEASRPGQTPIVEKSAGELAQEKPVREAVAQPESTQDEPVQARPVQAQPVQAPPAREHHTPERSPVERAIAPHHASEQATSERTSTERTANDRPSSEMPSGARATATRERSLPERPAAAKPAAEGAIGERSPLIPPQHTSPNPEHTLERPSHNETRAHAQSVDDGIDYDEQFTSDLEAVFNDEHPASVTDAPAVAAESRSSDIRQRASAEIAPPEPPARKRSENMEEEMQRLLDELSGSKPH
jgi:hypothetical protein